MKKAILLLLLIAAPVQVEALTDYEYCKQLSEYSESVMKARQMGVPLHKMMDIAQPEKVLMELTLAAYDRPKMFTEKVRREFVNEFASQVLLDCMKKLGGNKND